MNKNVSFDFFKEASKSKYFPFLLMVLCTLLNTIAQYFLKRGTAELSFDIIRLLSNFEFLFGCFIYAISSVFLVIALKYGELSSIYPLISVTYIWVALVSFFFLHESLGAKKIGGIAVILCGVAMITFGSSKGGKK